MTDLIYQVAVGKDLPDFYWFCIDSVAAYCRRIDADHIVQIEPVLKIRPLKSCRSVEAVEKNGYLPIYEKENAFNLMGAYDRVAVIDADVFIRPTAPNIFDELGDATFAAVVERDMPITDAYRQKIVGYSRGQYKPLSDIDWHWNPGGAEFYNMGVLVFSAARIAPYLRGQTPEQFIRRREFERFVNGEGQWRWSTEQTLLNWWIRKEGMKIRHLPWQWNALYPGPRGQGVRIKMIPEAYFVHFFLSTHLPQHGREVPELCSRM